jgi:hypothetical protein
MEKLWGLLRHNWGKALVTAIIGTALTLANVPPAIIGTIAKAGSDAAAEYAEEKHQESEGKSHADGDNSRGRGDGERRDSSGSAGYQEDKPADASKSAPNRAAFVACSVRRGLLPGLAFDDAQSPGGGSSGRPLVFAQLLERKPGAAQLVGRPSFASLHVFNEVIPDPERLPGAPRDDAKHAHLQQLTAGLIHAGASGPSLSGAQAAASDSGGKTGRHFALMAG